MIEAAVDPSDYMVQVASSPVGRAYKAEALRQLGLACGASVLDLGCGPGMDLLDYAAAVGDTGSVIGIDHDATAVEQARERTNHLPQVRVYQRDIAALGLPDGSVDAVHTDRVLQHGLDPSTVLAEAFRVLKVGGQAVFAEPDWRTLVIDHRDSFLSDLHPLRRRTSGANARLGSSQLARLCHVTGFAVGTVIPITCIYDDPTTADQILGLGRVAQRARTAGLMTDDEHRRWIDDLPTDPFFASATLFIVKVSKESAGSHLSHRRQACTANEEGKVPSTRLLHHDSANTAAFICAVEIREHEGPSHRLG